MRHITLNNTISAPVRVRPRETPLVFKPLTVGSIAEIRPLLAKARTRANDFSVGGLTMWTDYFHYEYCIYAGTLFIKGVSEVHPELPAFSLPVGSMPLEKAVELIVGYCRANGLPVRFSAVPADRIDELRAIIPGREEKLDDWSDYIYDAVSLATLSGKKYNKKRNHVNRFMAENPGYAIEPLTADNLTEVRRAYTGWLGHQAVEAASAAEESVQTLGVIDNYGMYPFEGILLRDGKGRVVAFTMGEVIGDTLFSHIEKMDHDVAGAGESINKMFAEYMTGRYPGLRYINREEDAGDEGLRQAKLSYHPAIILEKFDLVV